MAINENLKKYNDMNKDACMSGGVDNYKKSIEEKGYKKGAAVGGGIGAIIGAWVGIKVFPKIHDLIFKGISKNKQLKENTEILKEEKEDETNIIEKNETEGGESCGNIEHK